jgi:hypothetical protein
MGNRGWEFGFQRDDYAEPELSITALCDVCHSAVFKDLGQFCEEK